MCDFAAAMAVMAMEAVLQAADVTWARPVEGLQVEDALDMARNTVANGQRTLPLRICLPADPRPQRKSPFPRMYVYLLSLVFFMLYLHLDARLICDYVCFLRLVMYADHDFNIFASSEMLRVADFMYLSL